jgi:hypothetical protein
MDIKSTHARNPLMGWDISSSATAGKGEAIARAQIIVNGSPEYDESFDPAINDWQEQLQQQGVYPGDNKVMVVITDDKGNDKRLLDSWST